VSSYTARSYKRSTVHRRPEIHSSNTAPQTHHGPGTRSDHSPCHNRCSYNLCNWPETNRQDARERSLRLCTRRDRASVYGCPRHPATSRTGVIHRDSFPILSFNPWQASVWIPVGSELFLLIARRLSSPWVSCIINALTFDHPMRALYIGQTLPIALLAGTLVAVFGSYIRRSAYRALGPQFTYELSSRKEDRLVTTFPYNIVRHPSYAGGLLAILGQGISLLSSGGWLQTCVRPWLLQDASSYSRAVFGACMAPLAISYGTILVASLTRLSKEDDMMRKQFGEEWVAWASRVQSKIIPGVL
jgi:protein-S-isoprenylcysteine O-methyltransferase Ste14